MPRAKKRKVNKTALIKELLGKGLSNKEVVAEAKTQGITLSPIYVSNIKGKMGKAAAPSNGKARAARGMHTSNGSLGTLRAAVEFVRAAGGIEQAKEALATVEEIRQLA